MPSVSPVTVWSAVVWLLPEICDQLPQTASKTRWRTCQPEIPESDDASSQPSTASPLLPAAADRPAGAAGATDTSKDSVSASSAAVLLSSSVTVNT